MNWNMYLFVFEASKNYSLNLSKIAMMSVAITDVYISGFEQVFPCKATSYLKLVSNFINDESSPYR